MKEIKLINPDEVTVVDDCDYAEISKYRWLLTPQGYARNSNRIEGKRQLLHRIILKTPQNLQTDHINCDKLDNRRENLRIATHSQNSANGMNCRGGTSQYKGVYWDKEKRKWCATIRINNKQKYIGRYKSEEQAARAYDITASKYFGKYARLNFSEK